VFHVLVTLITELIYLRLVCGKMVKSRLLTSRFWRYRGGSRVNAVFRDISCVLGVQDLRSGFWSKMVKKSLFWVKWSKIDFWPHGFGGLVEGADG